MSGAVRLKERIFVFMGLAVFGGVFLLCRPFNCILHVYVALNNFKNITLIAAVYSSSEFFIAILTILISF
jgi:hypothetical protein